MTKICNYCNNSKPLEDFHKDTRNGDGRQARCKVCISGYHRRRYLSNRDMLLAKKRKYHQKNREVLNAKKREYRRMFPEKERDSGWRKRGIDPSEAKRALNQFQECAICNNRDNLVPDHDHNTGKVRGILCNKCNLGIGLFNDDSLALTKAADYLKSTVGPVS